MKHQVKMLSSQKGVHDGQLHPVHFAEGEEYEIGPDLLQAFINCGAVELVNAVEGEKPQGDASQDGVEDKSEGDAGNSATEEKSEGDAPANKMKKSAPENKAKASVAQK